MRLDRRDINTISGLIVDAADRLIVPRYRQLADKDIHTKSGPNDLVTIADRETEAFLDKHISAAFPDSVLIGEESISDGLKSLDTLADRDRLVWVADPVDGTHNFVNGKRAFGVMLAAIYNGETIHGWIYDVIGRRMLTTTKGAGTYIDGARLQTAPATELSHCRGFAGMKYFPERVRPVLKAQEKRMTSLTTMGCAAHEYLRIAEGQADFAVYSRVKPWDHLAGTLAVTEAGGCAELWNGDAYYPAFTGHGLIVASSKDTANAIRAAFMNEIVETLRSG